MNRTDRLLAIILELQAKRWQRAEDLAATFGVSKRTIYRDVDALAESGVPVVASPGQGYSLAEGYFLPPLRFSADEAVILLLGGDYMARQFDAQYRAAAETAIRKIEAVLKEPLREDVDALRSRFRLVTPSDGGDSAQQERLAQVRRAIIERRTLHFAYHARSGEREMGRQTERDADPYELLYYAPHWFVVGYCHLRQDMRHFRLDRMDRIRVTAKPFVRRQEATPRPEMPEGELITARVLFNPQISRWVHEERSYYVVGEEDYADGLLVTLRYQHENDVLRWLLGWGAHARVLEPDSLRQRLLEEARRMAERYAGEMT